MTQVREVIVELLSQLGSSREAREYLRRFSSVSSYQFAVVKVGGGELGEHLPALVSALGFLRHAGLLPIVLHGAGPQLDQALAEAGITSERLDGMRVTSPEVMKVVRPVIYEANARLVDALEAQGTRARSLLHGVFEAEYLDEARYGLVGRVVQVHDAGIRAAVAAGALPIVGCLGESATGQMLNINADVAARALVLAVRPHKVVFLTPTGGLLDEDNRLISAINLASDYEALREADWVHSGMLVKLEQIKQLLDELPLDSSVSITSAEHLTRELFTHRGAGTLVRMGERFEHREGIEESARGPLTELLQICFGRTLDPGYFESLEDDELIWSASRRAAAVIVRGVEGVPYMDKFAVTPTAQGEGLGAALWQQIIGRYDRLYWRSRVANPVNAWYHRQADASVRCGGWQVFAYGVDLSALQMCADDAVARPLCWVGEKAP